MGDKASKTKRSGRQMRHAPSERIVGHRKSASKRKAFVRNRFKVSAAASVGASVLRTEVSTGHPHPVPATKKTLRSFWSGEFFLIVGVEPVTDVLYTQSPPISNMA